MIDTLTPESFEPHVGSGFTVAVGEEEHVLTLAEVTPRKAFPGYTRTPFSLMFDGARTDAMFDSQLIEMVHPEMGTLAIMISPVGKNADGTFRYEAVFG